MLFVNDLTVTLTRQELGIDPDRPAECEETSADSGFCDPDINDACGCNIWDEHSHAEHLEAFYYAAKCAHECGLEKVNGIAFSSVLLFVEKLGMTQTSCEAISDNFLLFTAFSI